jgi:hypothetical protein
MEVQKTEQTTDFLELINRMKYLAKLKPDPENDNSFSIPLKVNSYYELNSMVSSLLKTSISMLKNDASNFSNPKSQTGIDVMILLEIAQQLLPEDEMELLDELQGLY